jgi:DNA repair protein RecO (recombination protein O)
MKLISGKGFILKINIYNDNDYIINIFTKEYGKLSAIIKGVRKNNSKNKGHCRLGSCIEYELFLSKNNSGLSKIKKIVTIRSFLSENIKEQSKLSILLEISDYFLKINFPNNKIFYLWEELISLNIIKDIVFIGFLYKFFYIEGLLPSFKVNNIYEIYYWDINLGIVQNINNNISYKKISLIFLKVCNFCSKNKLLDSSRIRLTSFQVNEILDVFWWFYSFQVDYLPKSKKIYDSL